MEKTIMENGFFRVAAVSPAVKVTDVDFNVSEIVKCLEAASAEGTSLIVFPELSLTAYTCGDLFHNRELLNVARNGLERLCEVSRRIAAPFVVGAPLEHGGRLFNCAVVFAGGAVQGVVPKTFIPNYNEFYEKRWFASASELPRLDSIKVCGVDAPFGTGLIFNLNGVKVGVEICEDLWAPAPPSTLAATSGAIVIANLSASNDLIGKRSYLENLVKQQSARCICGYVYAGAGCGESSTDLVFDGKAIVAENGAILARSPRWQTESIVTVADIDVMALERDRLHNTTFSDSVSKSVDFKVVDVEYKSAAAVFSPSDLRRIVSPLPFVPEGSALDSRCDEIVNIQAFGLAQRLRATGCRSLVVGISGGLDSTLALLVAIKAFEICGLDRKGIVGVTMPGFGTTGRTYNNAVDLMKGLGVTIREIRIDKAVMQHFADIGHDPSVTDVTYENSQARERTQILMDIANQSGGMVLGTGDLSELALGWATYNGDHMSMYGVNAGVPKTLVRHLVRYFAQLPEFVGVAAALDDIVATPISPELTPASDKGEIAQKTEDLVGPYELHDFFLYYTLRYGFTPRRIYFMARKAFEGMYDNATVLKWMKVFFRRFFSQQFKRSCLPDGPKVGSVCLSPRGDWRMPSDASSAIWLKEIEGLKP